jgi:nicotinamidase-related amidase
LPALIIIDMQKAIDDASWAKHGPRNNVGAEDAALALIEAWRASGQPVYHVRHDSVEPESTYRPGQPGNEFKAGFEPREGETLVVKHTGSAFTGTGLAKMLRERAESTLVVAGVITNNSVETTVRHAATLGFSVLLAEDACFTYAQPDWRGVMRSAEDVHAMTLANLEGEYCQVASSRALVKAVGA